MKLREACVFVVFIKRVEVNVEGFVVQQFQRFFVKVSVFETIDRKHVRQFRRRLQAHMDVVAEEEFVADRNDIASRTIVLGRDTLLRNQFSRNCAEDVASLVVELLQTSIEFSGM